MADQSLISNPRALDGLYENLPLSRERKSIRVLRIFAASNPGDDDETINLFGILYKLAKSDKKIDYFLRPIGCGRMAESSVQILENAPSKRTLIYVMHFEYHSELC